jgi:hypothetical protein
MILCVLAFTLAIGGDLGPWRSPDVARARRKIASETARKQVRIPSLVSILALWRAAIVVTAERCLAARGVPEVEPGLLNSGNRGWA